MSQILYSEIRVHSIRLNEIRISFTAENQKLTSPSPLLDGVSLPAVELTRVLEATLRIAD